MNRLPEYLLEIQEGISKKSSSDSLFIYKSRNDGRHNEEFYLTMPLLAFVLQGKKRVRTPEGELMIHPGDLLCARKGVYFFHDTEAGRQPFESLLIFLDKSILNRLPRSQKETETKPFLKISPGEETKAYLHSLRGYLTGNLQETGDLLTLKILELFHLLESKPGLPSVSAFFSPENLSRRTDLKTFIDTHYLKRLTLSEMADLSGRSLSAFKRDFQTVFKESPGTYLRKQRLLKAREYLEKTDTTVSEVCFRLGFESLSHFSRSYKEFHGISPGRSGRKDKE